MADAPEGFTPLEIDQEVIRFIGPVFTNKTSPALFGFRIEERHCNWRGILHGGILSLIADMLLTGNAVRSGENAIGMVTASLTVDFIGRANNGDWVDIEVVVRKVGGKMAFADCVFFVERNIIARASAVFSVVKGPATEEEAKPGGE